jgi:hypothetical protein
MVYSIHSYSSHVHDLKKLQRRQIIQSECEREAVQILVIICDVLLDSLCGLVVTVLGYRSRGPGSILGTTRFSEK